MRTRIQSAFSVIFAILLAGTSVAGPRPRVPGLSEVAVAGLTPPGYKFIKALPWSRPDDPALFRILGFQDPTEPVAEKPVVLRLIEWKSGWLLRDSLTPNTSPATAVGQSSEPNYFGDLVRVDFPAGSLILARSIVFGGGSGSLQYFDFFAIRDGKLVLVKRYQHGKFEQYYFKIYGGSVFDAELKCQRGEKHGKSFVYTCHLDVTRFEFDGDGFREIGIERWREKKGPWFLEDDYRFVDIGKALERGELFRDARP